MRPGELYLDSLFPLAVIHGSRLLAVPPERGCTLIVVNPEESPGSVEVGTEGGVARTVEVGPGLSWLAADVRLRIRAASSVSLVIGRRLLDEVAIAAFGEPGFSRFLEELTGEGCSSLSPETARRIADSASEVGRALTERRAAFRTQARMLLGTTLIGAYRAGLISDRDEPAVPHRLASIVDYIEKHCAEELSLSFLAGRAGVSASHLSRHFSREVGVPVSEFINRTRIRRACVLLRDPGTTITDIAFEVGYNNISFFNRYFRKTMKMTPREYRRYLLE